MSVELKIQNNIGFIEFNLEDSKVNLLTSAVLKQLDKVLDDARNQSSIRAIVFVSAKKDVFIAGADIKEIESITDPKEGQKAAKFGQDVLNKIEDLKVPTIAVIDGVALGGGCELALACLYRVSTFNDKVKIGLPEVNLGFVPGFGGTYRLPRIIGLGEAMKMILPGKTVDSGKALRVGLVDKLFPQVGLDVQVLQFVQEIVDGKVKKTRYQRAKKKGLQGMIEESKFGHGIVFSESKKSVLKSSKGFYPAPLKAIDVISENFYTDRTAGLEIEAAGFGELAVTAISKNLVHVFYLSEEFKKLKVDGAENIRPKEITKCGILGAGIMGGGIAQLLSSRGIWCRLKDINHDAIGKGLAAARKIYESALKSRRMDKATMEEKMAHITGTLDYSGFGSADIVIEAVVENLDVKKKVFKELSENTREDAILASNTSALSVTEMAKVCKNPSRVVGFHFFNPVHRMPLVEVITTPMTSTEAIVSALNLVKRLGKTPIVCKDSAGFIVNRLLLGYIAEGGRILEECGEMEKVDKLVTDFGMPMGPFTLSDEVGLDVGVKVMHILESAFGERFKACSIFEKVIEKKLLGKKTGKGFYIHAKERTPNPEIAMMLPPKSSAFKDQEYIDRMILTMVNEGARCLEEKVVDAPGAVDIGMIFGTGFPPFRGGLLKHADSIGIAKVVERLEELRVQTKSDRFKPCQYLLDLKAKGKGFYK